MENGKDEVVKGNLEILESKVKELYSRDMLVWKVISADTILYRIQDAGHPTADIYPKSMAEGRFKDPLGEMGTWYGATHPAVSIAETFGRLRKSSDHQPPMVTYEKMASRKMWELKTSRSLKVLDLGACLSMLGLRADQVVWHDYTLTNALVKVLCRLPGRPFDGIEYDSRHHQAGQKCYALWLGDGETPHVVAIKNELLTQYRYSCQLPKNWPDSDISAQGIMEHILGYLVL